MSEDQQNWDEMIKTMTKINKKSKKMFNTAYIKDQVSNLF